MIGPAVGKKAPRGILRPQVIIWYGDRACGDRLNYILLLFRHTTEDVAG